MTMTKQKITIHNKTDIKAQVQIFAGRILISTGMTNPGETCCLEAETGNYDIFLRNGVTGWEIARKLNSAVISWTLMRHIKGWYALTAS